jgi:hypothetical protein
MQEVWEGDRVSEFTVKDSGVRQEYPSGMRRDTQNGKVNFLLLRDGPMLKRWAEHMTLGAGKYGSRNWQLADSEEELERFRASAARHFEQWLAGESDEDHAAACFFNLNAAEFLRERLTARRLAGLNLGDCDCDGCA